eukprot:CAMPEP_0115529110 /NCGR_PEP_ID=MMETSP0271-20121206/83755_1 /TAXON_ID=71861 /ORGANISM="Scrippsiella trochoidea, Strain CCMP3099" /LENGTH=68 /DNA_ID=CAMNT_0002961087 /DNA_START=225 /DNA_END=431 /DNA_ORIENTATION=-
MSSPLPPTFSRSKTSAAASASPAVCDNEQSWGHTEIWWQKIAKLLHVLAIFAAIVLGLGMATPNLPQG